MSVHRPPSGQERHVATIARIPVYVDPTYALLLLFLGVRSPDFAWWGTVALAMTTSLLVHELGHAVPARGYGRSPSIALHGMGGVCRYQAKVGDDDRTEQLVITLAGPAAGLLLGGVAWAVGSVLPQAAPATLHLLVRQLAYMGLFWSVMNLLPVLPLDGGLVLVNRLLGAREPGEAYALARRVGAVAGLVGAAVGVAIGSTYVMLLFGLLAWWNFAQRHASAPVRVLRTVSASRADAPRKTLEELPDGTWRVTTIGPPDAAIVADEAPIGLAAPAVEVWPQLDVASLVVGGAPVVEVSSKVSGPGDA